MASITPDPIDPQAAVARLKHSGAGALLSFTGIVRDNHRGRKVVGIEYHSYEEMALKELSRIEDATEKKWPGIKTDIVHRIGALEVGEASVLITVASPHRADGFAALRHAIDTIKDTVPIWKKEIYVDGIAWIEGS